MIMNKELVFELSRKAWLERYTTVDPDYVHAEALIRLVVSECINQIPKDMDFYDRNRAIDNITRHFGVEV